VTAKTAIRIRVPTGARTVVLLAYDGCQSLDVTGPWEVFAKANGYAAAAGRAAPYRLRLASPAGGSVPCNSGLVLADSAPLRTLRGPIDTLLVAGGNDGVLQPTLNTVLVPWLRRAAGRTRRTCSVCTGAFVLAATGLLGGRRVSTHWAYCDALAQRHPELTVEPDAIYVADAPFYSSAGITAGIDLALALVEEDLGAEAALHAARHLVLYLRRQGGQSQYSLPLRADAAAAGSARFAALRAWMANNLRADLSVPALAARACISARQFGRAFQAETGFTPARYVEQLRLDAARALLESTGQPLKRVADRVGFGSVDALQRSLRRGAGASPAEYRQRFGRG
jgi:transcriptional regulator GlxA family with amidase domain